jgi:hypothetical protein
MFGATQFTFLEARYCHQIVTRICESYHFPALQPWWPDKDNPFSLQPIFRNLST